MGDGRIDWSLRPPPPTASPVKARPVVGETSDKYFFDTAFGNYSFAKSTPYRVRVTAARGEVISAAWFRLASVPHTEGTSELVTRNATAFVSQYDLVLQGLTIARIRTTFEFFKDRPPKASAALTTLVDIGVPQLAWIVLTRDTTVRYGNTNYWDFHNTSELRLLEDPDLRVEVGRQAMFDGEEPSVWLGWSDAPNGTKTYAGKLDLPVGNFEGLFMKFPSGVNKVDPVAFSTSTSATATGYSSQRKIVRNGDRYWVFYDNGSGVGYRTTPDGTNWTDPRTVATGGLGKGFDVDARGPTIAIAWYSGWDLKFRKGTFYTDYIAWDATQTVSIASAEPPLPSVTIGADNAYWIAGHKVFRSINGASWSDKTTTTWTARASSTSATFLLPLRGLEHTTDLNSWVYAILNHPLTPPPNPVNLLVGLYNGSSGQWTEHSFYLAEQAAPRTNVISATITATVVHVLYTNAQDDNSYGTVLYRNFFFIDPGFDFTSSSDFTVADLELGAYYPSITVGPPGSLYAFWRGKVQGQWVVRNATSEDYLSLWSAPSSLFQVSVGQNPQWLSTPRYLYDRVIVVWRDVSAGCSVCNLLVGIVPLLDDFGASVGHPWARAGLSVGAPLIGEMSDAVNPASGQLVVRQVDAQAAGRRVDLTLSHVHTSPHAFQAGQPMFFVTNPTVPMGLGWEIGLPWISDSYVHLGNGQRYVIFWNGSRFENHVGAPFTLYNNLRYPYNGGYDLYFADGTHMNFTSSPGVPGKLSYIADVTGQSRITFFYSGDRLATIVDSLGRNASFSYYANGPFVGKLQSLAYAGRAISFEYTTTSHFNVVLNRVTYPTGLQTTYQYDTAIDYLLKGVTQPWGAATSYSYLSAPVGTEAVGYFATRQDIKDSTVTIRSRTFNYVLVNGWASATNITLGDGTLAKGYQVLGFASVSRGMTTLVKDAGGKQLSKTIAWFDPSGTSGATDVYLGDSTNRNYTNLIGVDDWGNPYYSRSAVSSVTSHERYASYGNANSHDAFRVPGILRMSLDGKILGENFERLDLSPWNLSAPGGTVGFNYSVVDRSPPSMRIASSSGSPATARRLFPSQSGAFLFTTSVRLGETTQEHRLVLEQGDTSRIVLRFASDGQVKWGRSDQQYENLQAYEANTWYRVSLEVDMASTATIVVNENRYPGHTIYSAGPVNRARYELTFGVGTIFVGDLGVARKNLAGADPFLAFRVTNLALGRKVEYLDLTDTVVWSGIVDSSGIVDVTSLHQVVPNGYLKVYNATGKEEYRSPFREFWPGSLYAYAAPIVWWLDAHAYTNTLSADVHNAPLATKEFQTGRDPVPTVPQEFYAKYLSNGLLNATKVYHNGIPLETTYSRDSYGNVGSAKDVEGKVVRDTYGAAYSAAWVMQERRALSGSDVTTRTTYNVTTGLASSATDWRGHRSRVFRDGLGRAIETRYYDPEPASEVLFWDMETLSDAGQIEDFSGHGNQGTMSGDLGFAEGRVDQAKTFSGSASRVYALNSSSLSITSSFSLASWVRYDSLSGSNPRTIVSKYDGTTGKGYLLQLFGEGAGADAKKLRLVIGQGGGNEYKSTGTLPNSLTWYHAAVAFDDTANTVTFYINGVASGQTTGVSVAPAHNAVHLSVGLRDDGTWNDAWSGRIDDVRVFNLALAAADVQAISSLTFQENSRELATYNDPARTVTYEDADGRRIRETFDSLGRETKVERLDPLGNPYSTDTLAYNWQDLVVTATSPTGNVTHRAYDLFGRIMSETYADGNATSYAYFDAALYRTVTGPNGHTKSEHADFSGRVTKVVERWSGGSNATSYVYDEVGNLLTVTDPYLRSTVHSYDDLNRLTKTSFYDGKTEEYAYTSAGAVSSKKGRDGQNTSYSYDGLYHLTLVHHQSSTDDVSYTNDADGNPLTVFNDVAVVTSTYDLKGRAASERLQFEGAGEPDVTTAFSYTLAGDLTSISYPGTPFTLSYERDEYHRTKRAYSGATNYAQFSYHTDDTAKGLTFGNGLATSFAYDKRSRPWKITTLNGGTTTWSFQYVYDQAGNVLSRLGSNIPSMTFAYDQDERLAQATGTGWGTMTYGYDAVGNRKALGYGSATPQDTILRPNAATPTTQWSKSGSGGANWDRVAEATADGDASYVYSSTTGQTDLYELPNITPTGPINSVTVVAVAKTVWSSACPPQGCYSQLKLRVNGTSSPEKDLNLSYGTVSQTWTRNPTTNANWTTDDVNGLRAGIENVWLSATTRVTQVYVLVNVGPGTNYVYGLMNELTSTTGIDEATYAYDANGNLATKTSYGVTWTYTYNAMGLLKQVKQGSTVLATYFYDGLGRRVKTVEGSTTTFFAYAGAMDPIYQVAGGTETRYVYANGMRIAKVVVGGPTYYYHEDALGSTWRISDVSKSVVLSTNYEPFGRSWGTSGPLSGERFRFLGERNDTESGLVYLRARQYDPKAGRFVSADPILGHLSAPQTQNRYSYAVNNPLKYSDPSGMDLSAPPEDPKCMLFEHNQLCGTPWWPFVKSIEWYKHASDRDRTAFWWGVAAAFAIGVAVGATCVVMLCSGLIVLGIIGFGTTVLGSVAAGVVYRAAGGQSEGGLEAAELWGGLAAGIGMSVGGFLADAFGWGDAGVVYASTERPLTVDDVLADPELLRTAPGRLKTPAEVPELIADAESKGWRVTVLGKGGQKGAGLRLLGPDGSTIRFNPWGTHHPGPYWKVASGSTGTYWVRPWLSVLKGWRG